MVEEIHNTIYKAECYLKIGNGYWKLALYDKSIEYHEKALNLFIKSKLGEHLRSAKCYNYLGLVHCD